MGQVNANMRVVLLSLFGNIIIMLAKLLAFLVGRSPSMLAEAIHTGGDALNQFLIYIGLKKGQIGPCHRFPMGQGRGQYAYNQLAAIGICLGALYTYYHSYEILSALENQSAQREGFILSVSILFFSCLIEGFIFYKAITEVNKMRRKIPLLTFLKTSDDPSIIGILLEDGIAVSGVLIALLGQVIGHLLHSPLPDIVASLMIATLLLVMGIYLWKMNYNLIVGPALQKELVQEIRNFILSRPEVESIEQFSTEILAPSRVRLSVEISFNGDYLVGERQISKSKSDLERHKHRLAFAIMQTHDRAIRALGPVINQLETEIKAQFPTVVIIDIEPH